MQKINKQKSRELSALKREAQRHNKIAIEMSRRNIATYKKIRSTCEILRSVAKSYKKRSPEYIAIIEAAEAFVFHQMNIGMKESYMSYMK